MTNTIILGAGFTGLAAGITSGATVYEASDHPGGLGASYQLRDYRFEVAGGHWLFALDQHPSIKAFIQSHCTLKRYERRASVYFPDDDKFCAYPLQQSPEWAEVIKEDLADDAASELEIPNITMKDALRAQFGGTACAYFFYPFNDAYTAGLYDKVAPQDAYKSPKTGTGYNVSFYYPQEGLGHLARRMAAMCNVRFNKRVVNINTTDRELWFDDGSKQFYDRLISTIPLNRIMELTGWYAGKPDPFVSVDVINIGATRGSRCPDDHWVYIPSGAKFHRVGFYSNVDPMFAPEGKVAIYVESTQKPSYKAVIDKLREWGWIANEHVWDLTTVEVAYTYHYPGSAWREDALELLWQHDIHSIGRFGSWRFCGIVESMKEGFEAGAA